MERTSGVPPMMPCGGGAREGRSTARPSIRQRAAPPPPPKLASARSTHHDDEHDEAAQHAARPVPQVLVTGLRQRNVDGVDGLRVAEEIGERDARRAQGALHRRVVCVEAAALLRHNVHEGGAVEPRPGRRLVLLIVAVSVCAGAGRHGEAMMARWGARWVMLITSAKSV